MAEPRKEKLTPELVEQRMRELSQLYELGVALREVRFVSRPEAAPIRPVDEDGDPRKA